VRKLLTVAEAAERTGVSESLVYAWCSGGQLPHFRLGNAGRRGAIRIAEADLDALLASCRVEAPSPNAPTAASPSPPRRTKRAGKLEPW
jgi:excisionase family DNA binding protein